jgi:hypothetical protein
VIVAWREASRRPVAVQLAAFIQQRIRHVYRRQWPAPVLGRMAKSRQQQQLGVDGRSRPPVLLV